MSITSSQLRFFSASPPSPLGNSGLAFSPLCSFGLLALFACKAAVASPSKVTHV